MSRNKNASKMAKDIKERRGYGMILETYVNANIKATFECPTHGEFQAYPGNVRAGRQHCKKCYPKQNYKAYYERTFADTQARSPYKIVKETYKGVGKKATFTCQEHGEFTARVQDVIGAQGQRCPMCVKRRRKSKTKARNALKYDFLSIVHPVDREKLLSGEYGAEDKVRFRCEICKEYYSMIITSYKQGNRHLKCSAKKRGFKNRKRDYDFMHEIRKDYRKKVRNGEMLSTDKVPFMCKEHGEYWQRLVTHNRGGGCPECGKVLSALNGRMAYNFDDIRPDYKDRVAQKEFHSHDKVPFICEIHGEYWQSLTQRKRGFGCPTCGQEKASKNRRKQSYSIYHQLRDDYKQKVDNAEITTKDNAIFVCEKHGEFERQIGEAELKSVDSQTACPACNLARTPYNFYEFLCTLADNVVINDRQQIKPKEIDFYLPDHNIGFEFNDIRTHQTLFTEQEENRDNRGGKPQSYHYSKFIESKNEGIRLFQIWDIEWSDDRIRPILESVIRNALGMNEHRIYARNCRLVASDSKECNPFFRENHIQGAARGSGYFALKHKGEIVGAICYAKKIKLVDKGNKNNADITISRMCFKQNTSIIGGASRLLKAVMNTMQAGQTIEYLVLNDYFDGVSFEATGWKEAKHYSMVRYYDKEKKHSYYRDPHKYRERKEMCLNNKMYRYFTSGTTVYRKTVL
ncbi:MAG: hypothetical protein WC292_00035 [Clostridia bacterium]